MSRNILVSIISDQTVPNYLPIKEFWGKIDFYLFISTRTMEEKSKTLDIVSTAGIEKNQYKTILVQEDTLFKAKEELAKFNFSDKDNFIINLTGGTKLMTLTVWQFFSQFKNIYWIYVPLGKNIYKIIYPDKPAKIKEFKYELNYKEYLAIYGIEISSESEEKNFFFSYSETKRLLNIYLSSRKKLNAAIKLKYTDVYKDNLTTKWFEELLFYKIKHTLNLNNDKIGSNIKIISKITKPEGALYDHDNELDIFFMYQNRPFLVEVKLSISQNSKLHSYLFKLAGVNKRFGLSAKATLITLEDYSGKDKEFHKALENRCKVLNLYYPLDRNKIVDETKFKKEILNFVQK